MSLTSRGFDRSVESLSGRALQRALAGRNDAVPPLAALYGLWRSPEKRSRTAVFRSVLENRDYPPSLRQTAALYLGKAGDPDAVTALEDNLRIRDPLIRGAVLRALGRSGGAGSLGRIGRLTVRGRLAREARFAITLLAYRHGVEGHRLRLPRRNFLEPSGRRQLDLEVRAARPGERTALAGSLRLEPLGMPVDLERVYRLSCGPRHMALVLNRDVTDADDLRALSRKPLLVAQILHWHEHDEAFAPIFYVLAHASGPERVDVAVLNSGGRLCCAGVGSVARAAADFVIRGVDHPGNTPAHLAGTFERGIRLDRARVGAAVKRARHTTPSTVIRT